MSDTEEVVEEVEYVYIRKHFVHQVFNVIINLACGLIQILSSFLVSCVLLLF